MIDKFKILNKINIDIDKYEEDGTYNKEDLKGKMQERLKSSDRMNKRKNRTKTIISAAASISIVIIGIGVFNPSLADNIIRRLPEFETMLDKLKESIEDDGSVEYSPELYPELEEEKEEYKKSKLIATPVNLSSKSEGLDITIDKVMYDKKKIYLDITLKTDVPFKESKFKKSIYDSPYEDGVLYMDMDNVKMYMNGIKLDGYSWSSGVVEYIDEYTLSLSNLIELDPTNDIDETNFKITFDIPDNKYRYNDDIEGKWAFNFNIKSIDDGKKDIEVNKKDGDYTLKSIGISKTYAELKMELPFQPSLGNTHDNFIIVYDDKGRELEMTVAQEGANKMYTQINELINIGETPKYIDIFVYENIPVEGEDYKPLSSFRVMLD